LGAAMNDPALGEYATKYIGPSRVAFGGAGACAAQDDKCFVGEW
jgi:hypothetical protein